MESIKKQVHISKVFTQYIFIFCIGTIALLLLGIILFALGMKYNVILPANYYAKQIELKSDSLKNSETVTSIIPEGWKYAVFDYSGHLLQGSINEKDAALVWEAMNKGDHSIKNNYYSVIKRKNDICVIFYTLKANFNNLFLQKYFPNAEVCGFILFIALFIIEVLSLSHYFGKSLSKEMSILEHATKRIQVEDLDFEVEQSKIFEINEILNSLVKMKQELQYSLNRQWEMENTRKEQIAALAHDIKTPLTILRGNAELLEETSINREQETYNHNILQSIDDMEKYIKTLLDVNQSENGIQLRFEKIQLHHFIEDIISQSSTLALDKHIHFIKEQSEIPEVIYADGEALKRAIMNIIINGIEYCPENGDLIFLVMSHNNKVQFIIEDCGRGFSEEEMVFAAKKFYRGDKSRSSKTHYGMGVYIAQQFAKLHNGNIYLSHSEKLGGAKVILEVPSNHFIAEN